MKPITTKYVKKADGDYTSALILSQSGNSDVYDQVCTHAQQSAEKYLKAYLYEHSKPFPRTHDMDELLSLCVQVDASFEAMSAYLSGMTPYAVEYRYPGADADAPLAQTAFQDITFVRTYIRAKLGL